MTVMVDDNAVAIFQAKLAALHAQFLAELPEKIAQLQLLVAALVQRWSTAEAVELHRQVHSLTGAAGTFGCAELSRHARALERLLKPWIGQSQLSGSAGLAGSDPRSSAPLDKELFDKEQWQAILSAWEQVVTAAAAVTIRVD